jgi:hypothetical protein
VVIAVSQAIAAIGGDRTPGQSAVSQASQAEVGGQSGWPALRVSHG